MADAHILVGESKNNDLLLGLRNLDLGVSKGQQYLVREYIHDFWMKFDKFSKRKEELLDH